MIEFVEEDQAWKSRFVWASDSKTLKKFQKNYKINKKEKKLYFIF